MPKLINGIQLHQNCVIAQSDFEKLPAKCWLGKAHAYKIKPWQSNEVKLPLSHYRSSWNYSLGFLRPQPNQENMPLFHFYENLQFLPGTAEPGVISHGHVSQRSESASHQYPCQRAVTVEAVPTFTCFIPSRQPISCKMLRIEFTREDSIRHLWVLTALMRWLQWSWQTVAALYQRETS